MSKAWDIVEGLISVAQVVVKAIRNGDEEKVDEILSEELKNQLWQKLEQRPRLMLSLGNELRR